MNRRTFVVGSILSALAPSVGACVSPALEVAREGPASPRAGTAPAPRSVHALSNDFRIEALSERAPSNTEARGGEAPAAPVPSGAHYTCPMHPDVVSGEPGPCPRCGMPLVLEKETSKP